MRISVSQANTLLEMGAHDLDSTVEVICGVQTLALSPGKWGGLRNLSNIAINADLVKRDKVLEARRPVVEHLMAQGHLMPGTDLMKSIAHPNAKLAFMPQVAEGNSALM